MRSTLAIAALAAIIGLSGQSSADDVGDLAAAAQNPVADIISLPFQNNTYFGVGPDDDTANALNIQPVIPVSAGEWNLINRSIIPILSIPDSLAGTEELSEGADRGSDTFGLGDINHTVYVSPAAPGKIIWGIGPSLTLPTATSERLGSKKWSAGPAAVVLTMDGPWVYGGLVRNLWSFAGDSNREDVDQFLFQPFVNYNMDDGWYLASSPIITANWNAHSSERWTVPVGGGVGKVFTIGGQPINASAHSYYNIERPAFGPEWALRLQIQFLFPK